MTGYISMPHLSSGSDDSESRLIVKALFLSSCLLSIVSWYTTQQGMALYLNAWFSVLASAGVQSALVLVAWLIGFSKARRGLLICVYAITAAISIAFSYVSLHTWFAAKERPAAVERKLYDTLVAATATTEKTLTAAIEEQQRHILALEEMTAAEKTHGHISRAQDADPYLARMREAVSKEAATYSNGYKEGAGEGVRYTAFDRYTKLAKQTLEHFETSQRSLIAYKAKRQPLDPSDKQLREFHQVYDAVPWTSLEQSLHNGEIERPSVPNYAEYLDKTVSSQEDLMVAFEDLAEHPFGQPAISLALAAFIDIIVFLLAYSSGPYFHGSSERRWSRAAAIVDTADAQVFVRNFLRKLKLGERGLPSIANAEMTPGERQLCLILASKGLAAAAEHNGEPCYLIEPQVQEELLHSLLDQGMPLRAASAAAAAAGPAA